MKAPRRIAHGAVGIALHELRAGSGPTLLLLHELGGSSTDWSLDLTAWAGPVLGLDFAGHGDSDWRPGGAYVPELFAADADAVLAAIGPANVAGAGLGAYVALLLAGARPELVSAALLLPGNGLEGGGPYPDPARFVESIPGLDPAADRAGSSDPMTLSCARDIRPPQYAREFARAARRLVLAEDGTPRPPWWEAIRDLPAARALPRTGDGWLQSLAARAIGEP
jgi:pimeloyl-ACP methyl ester carboxylesterase